MPSPKLLKSVAHDIAHHAQSGLSWLHPHLGQACRSTGEASAVLELLDAFPYPRGLQRLKPLELALQGLQERFWMIVESHGLERSTVASVRLQFVFPKTRTDDYLCSVAATITAANGRVYEKRVL